MSTENSLDDTIATPTPVQLNPGARAFMPPPSMGAAEIQLPSHVLDGDCWMMMVPPDGMTWSYGYADVPQEGLLLPFQHYPSNGPVEFDFSPVIYDLPSLYYQEGCGFALESTPAEYGACTAAVAATAEELLSWDLSVNLPDTRPSMSLQDTILKQSFSMPDFVSALSTASTSRSGLTRVLLDNNASTGAALADCKGGKQFTALEFPSLPWCAEPQSIQDAVIMARDELNMAAPHLSQPLAQFRLLDIEPLPISEAVIYPGSPKPNFDDNSRVSGTFVRPGKRMKRQKTAYGMRRGVRLE